MAESYPVNIPSGSHLLPRASGANNLGSLAYPFLNVYSTNVYAPTVSGTNLYGSHIIATVLKSGVNYTAGLNDCFIDVDTTGGNRTITLPTAVGNAGKEYNVRKLSSDGYQVIVSGTSSQTINGVATKEILYQYTNMQLLSNGTNWRII